ncbi:hypothetical protein [Microbacterium sp. 10M-3C3]|jgi:hypothetical protein|uniref:hypothetical protein n=1 Tax=Microbacterium sp. 10M-3C3 TaxID=2483401 RepID=UPI000F63D54D|nr:hypothetical protein [Microbacterium sp. 10M-3C3]
MIGPYGRVVFSVVQTVLLAAAVTFCAVMLIGGDGGPGNVFVIAIIFLSLSLAGHATFLFLSYRSARRHPRSP